MGVNQRENTWTGTAGEAVLLYRRGKFDGTNLVYADASDDTLGHFVGDFASGSREATVRLVNGARTQVCIADGAVTAGATVYPADDGKVTATLGSKKYGIALEAANYDGHAFEVFVFGVGGSSAMAAPGAGISGGTGTVCKTGVEKIGDFIKTTILLNLTGLTSSATDGDVIGVDDTGAAYFARILAAQNGTIFASKVTCLEAPATGDDDIAIYSATEATGVEDSAIADLTETLLLDHGAWSADTFDSMTTVPPANGYLYLVAKGGDTAGTYTAGQLLIELWGT